MVSFDYNWEMPIGFIWIGLLIGGIAGLLVNYLSDVLPASRRFSQPICMSCTKPKTLPDYLLWKKCKTCGAGRPLRDYLVVMVTTVLGGITWMNPSHRLGFWIGIVLLIFLGVVFTIDVEHRIILNEVSVFGFLFGSIVGIWVRGFWETLVGGFTGFLIMYGLYFLGDRYARWMARRRGEDFNDVALGFGDVYLGGILGLLLGWPVVIAGIFVTIILGGAFSLVYLLFMVITRKYQPFMAIPYAPFIVIAIYLFLYVIRSN
jgi:leader peptidase (prepilin peptidase)/N-methyltransferase